MWWFFIPAIVAGGVASYLLLSRGSISASFGDKLVLHQVRLPDDDFIVDNYVPNDWFKYPVSTAQDVLDAISRHPRISRLAIISHGTPTYILDRNLTPEILADALAGRLTYGAVVGFAGCSVGRSPGEPATWDSPHIYQDGGADSYTGLFRDAAVDRGAPASAEARTHSILGHTTANPAGRTFYFAERGGPGRTIKPAHLTGPEWVAEFQGEPATYWILGVR